MTQNQQTAVIHVGDAIELLRKMPTASIDIVLCDPPYGINLKSDGDGKLSPWADLCNAAFWYTAWIGECRRVLREDGCLWSFLNWRSLPTFQKAACDLGWPITSLLVWDKEWIGPSVSGLRPSYEMVALWMMPKFEIVDRGIPDIRRCKWASHKPTGHPAEKPVELLAWLLDASGSDNETVVLDPFCGSGSTGVACRRVGSWFVGCEIDEAWAVRARTRIAGESSLFAGLPQ